MPRTDGPAPRRAALRLAAFALVLAAALGSGWAVGAAVGPEPPDDRPASTHDHGQVGGGAHDH